LERLLEDALSEAMSWEVVSPEQVWVAEDKLDDGRFSFTTVRGPNNPTLRAKHIDHDLNVKAPVARVAEDENSAEARIRQVEGLRNL
jgi:hypothetical protein